MAVKKKKAKKKVIKSSYKEIGTYVPKGDTQGMKFGVTKTKNGPCVLFSFVESKYDEKGERTDYNVTNKFGKIVNARVYPGKTKVFRRLFEEALEAAAAMDE